MSKKPDNFWDDVFKISAIIGGAWVAIELCRVLTKISFVCPALLVDKKEQISQLSNHKINKMEERRDEVIITPKNVETKELKPFILEFIPKLPSRTYPVQPSHTRSQPYISRPWSSRPCPWL